MTKAPVKPASASIKVKRSEFIGLLQPISSRESFRKFLKQTRREYHKAKHICWAYRLFENAQLFENSSDAGEPSGSAGYPIFNAIKRKKGIQVGISVVRYFGGVKLGKNGLSDAYGTVAEETLNQTVWKSWIEKDCLVISADYSLSGRISRWLDQLNGNIIEDLSAEKVEWLVEIDKIQDDTPLKELSSLGVVIKKKRTQPNQGGNKEG